MTAKHTGGEWKFDGEDMDNESCASWGGFGYEIFAVDSDGDILEPIGMALNEEDARLMVASPKLLAALEAAHAHLNYCGYGDNWERECSEGLDKQITAAIALAKGEAL